MCLDRFKEMIPVCSARILFVRTNSLTHVSLRARESKKNVSVLYMYLAFIRNGRCHDDPVDFCGAVFFLGETRYIKFVL